MNPLLDRDARQIIPRWRDVETTAKLGEVGVPLNRAPAPVDRSELQLRETEWKASRTAPFAADFLAAAVSVGEIDSAQEAIEFLVSPAATVPALARRVALNLARDRTRDDVAATPLTKPSLHSVIRDQKARLRFEPRDPLAWAELARGYILLGFRDQALSAMARAVSLAPANRFLLRSFARLLVHVKELERALSVLQRSPASPLDPWLIAAEIAVAGLQKKPSRLAKTGERFVAARTAVPFHVTELASALGTLETASGSFQKAKKLFRLALMQPTENSVAQAEWASQHGVVVSLHSDHFNVPLSFEARAQHYLRVGEWGEAYAEIINWLNDQPFALKPAIQGSYVASVVLEDYQAAINVVEFSQIANPNDWTLRNNLAFAYASGDRTAEAAQVFSQLSPHVGNLDRHPVWLATAGLIQFRTGHPDRGVVLYRASIEEFARAGNAKSKALAAVFLARESARAGMPEATEFFKIASEAATAANSPEVFAVLQRISTFQLPE